MDAGECHGTHYLVMELVQGVDLAQAVNTLGPLPIAAACEIIRQAAVGLQHVYENGLVHRDIKPSNLMLATGPQGVQVKILDLGLALLDEQQPAGSGELTSTGQIMGTIDYMAPEQAGDTHTVDIRADIYSLGAALYRLLTGRVPYHSPRYTTSVKKLLALTTHEPPRIDTLRPDLPPQLVQIVHCMLAREPEQRYPTPQAVAEALAPFAAEADLKGLLDAIQEAGVVEDDASRSGTTVSKTGDHPTGFSYQPPQSADGDGQPYQGQRGVSPVGPQLAGASPLWYRRKALLASVAMLPLLLLGVVLLVLRTPYGEVVVELADGIPAEAANQLKIEVVGNGQLQVADAQQGWTISVAEGTYRVQLAGGSDSFQLDRSLVTVSRDQRAYLKVSLKPAESVASPAGAPPAQPAARPQRAPWNPNAEQQAFFDHVRTLPPTEQFEAVAKKLRELNRGYNASYQYRVVNGRAVALRFTTANIAVLWPIRALEHLQFLYFDEVTAPAKLVDLAPLAGLKLKKLEMGGCYHIGDLSPLAGMPLTHLIIHGTNITDLSPLKGMRLESISLRGCRRLSDLSPLRGMPLKYADFTDCRGLRDISPLQALPLETLLLRNCTNADLSSLRGMSLKTLDLAHCHQVLDLTALAGLPLEHLTISYTPIADLTPLRGMRLMYLDMENTRVTDLGPLAGAPLQTLYYMDSPIADFSILKAMPLESLSINRRLFDDERDSILRSLPLQQVRQPDVDMTAIPIDQYWSQLETLRKDAHAFVKQTAALPPAERATAVQQALEKANGADAIRLTFLQEGSWDQALLNLAGIAPRDLAPVMALTSLKRLTISGGSVAQDLSCLKFLPLEELTCRDGMARTNLNVLRTISTLKTINGRNVPQARGSAQP